MKALTTILYLCSGLMAAAAVMGAIDYKKAEHKGSLEKLYKEDENPLPIAKKVVDIDNYSRAKIDMPVEKEQPKEMKIAMKEQPVTKYKPVVEDEQEEENNASKKWKSVKFSEFSRGPLPRKHYKLKETIEITVDTTESKSVND